MIKYSALILASGTSQRFGSNKIIADLNGKPVIYHSWCKFNDDIECVEIIISVSFNIENQVKKYCLSPKTKIIIYDSKSRFESSKNGLNHVTSNRVLIHDGARPFISARLITDIAKENETAIPYKNIFDTVYLKDKAKLRKLERENLLIIETPQGFQTHEIKYAYDQTLENSLFTDDLSVYLNVYKMSKINFLKSLDKNTKITKIEDLKI